MAEMSGSLLDLSEELTCPICLCTFESPVTTPCGHNFCRFCLELTWDRADGSWPCPQCRTEFSCKPELRKNTVLNTVVLQYLLNKNRAEEAAGAAEEPAEPEVEEEEEDDCPPGSVRCDSCQKVAAVKTCLTCIASFCQEHLRPHQESKAFAHHRLHDPLGGSELGLRTCTKHNKLLEYYCVEHGQCLCCNCLTDHKACKTDTVPEAKRKREENMRSRRATLHDKIENVSSAFDKLSSQELKVLDAVNRRKTVLKEEFSEISTIIQREEQNAMRAIEEEEKRVKNKFAYTQDVLHKKKTEFENYKDKVDMLLSEEDDIIFLMKARKLNDSTTKDAYVPKIDCDETLLHNISRSVYCLKEMLRNQTSRRDRTTPDGCKESPVPPSEPSFKKIQRPNCPPAARGPSATRGEVPKNEPKNDSDQSDKPVEGLDKRRPRKKETSEELLKTVEDFELAISSLNEDKLDKRLWCSKQRLQQLRLTSEQNELDDLIKDYQKDVNASSCTTPNRESNGAKPLSGFRAYERPFRENVFISFPDRGQSHWGRSMSRGPRGVMRSRGRGHYDKTKKSNPTDTPSSSDTNLRSRSRDDFLKYKSQKSNPADTPSSPDTNLRSRDDFLKYAENLSLDFNTAHKRVVLTEGNTKIAVTDTPRNYNEHPQRFTHCSQVLGYQGFARGIHYWEVEIRSSNFCGIGVSYKSIDRRELFLKVIWSLLCHLQNRS
ncbi:E3 ubiquitin/ISG15 ligase TRIM25 isoform X2 [Ambystoma mexicanum]|uniref:E3 ubiquitin/ISG15 ligase TRIM25 isoform X2 n=1 Tax=Ambystoma mexicanum TaxID=8296 RepID=UPI0037E879B6